MTKLGPQIIIKEGVDMRALHGSMYHAAAIAGEVFDGVGLECVITSARRKAEGKFSWHHVGRALDFRGKHVPPAMRPVITARLKERLGPDFDVIAHGEGDNFHYHVEFDPKG